MSDVSRARLSGRDWWVRLDGDTALLFTNRDSALADDADTATYIVPAHMVERIEDIPPEPTEPGLRGKS